MTVTATSKPREVKYFEMTGTANGTQMRLTKPSYKALQDAFDVLTALSKAGKIFPCANVMAKELALFMEKPERESIFEAHKTATAT
jgi:hypothetical protein